MMQPGASSDLQPREAAVHPRPGGSLDGSRRPAKPARTSLYLPSIDGLRFIAFLLVLVHHVPGPDHVKLILKFRTYGWVGVEMFFVISSFLFFHLFRAEHEKTGTIRVGHFYLRRLIRLYPLMVAFPALMLVLAWDHATGDMVLRLLGLALFSDNLITWFRGYSNVPFSAHLWTLSFEFQIYLLIPLAFLVLLQAGRDRFLRLIGAVFGFCFALRLIFTGLAAPHPIVWATPFLHPDSVLLGLVISLGFVQRIPLALCAGAAILAGLAFVRVPVPWTGVEGAALSYPLAAITCGALLILALRWGALKALLASRPVKFLGTISFGLYVYHLLGIHLATRGFAVLGWSLNPTVNTLDWGALLVGSLVVTTAMAGVSYFAFERPLHRLKDRFAVVHGR